MALTRRDAWREALEVLLAAERDAGENADLFAALARAYRRAGDDRRAVAYFRRAMAIAPGDSDLAEGYEATIRAIGNAFEFEGLAESGVSDARSFVAHRIRPRRAAAAARGHRATAGAEWIVGRYRRRRRHFSRQSIDQLRVSRGRRREQCLARERRRDGGGQALPGAIRTGLQLPLSLLHRRQGRLVLTDPGVGHQRTMATGGPLHLFLLVVPQHRRHLR